MEVDNFIYKKFIDKNICDELINYYEKVLTSLEVRLVMTLKKILLLNKALK